MACSPSAAAMRATRFFATASFDCAGQDSTPRCRDEMHGIVVAAHRAAFRRDVVRDDPVAALALAASPWRARSPSRSRPRSRSRAAAASLCSFAIVARMSGFSTSASFGGPPASFFSFCSPAVGDAPVGDRGGEHADVGRQRRLDRAQHVARALDPHGLHAGRIGQRHRAATPASPRRRPRRPRARSRSPACRTSGSRCSAPDRSARGSGPP